MKLSRNRLARLFTVAFVMAVCLSFGRGWADDA